MQRKLYVGVGDVCDIPFEAILCTDGDREVAHSDITGRQRRRERVDRNAAEVFEV